MAHRLSFSESLSYDAGKTGITVPVTLRLSQAQVHCEAKVDTGASLCVFSRSYSEQLGLAVADGLRQIIGTVIGSFVVYLHEVDLAVAVWNSARSLPSPRTRLSGATCSGGGASSNR